MNAEPGADIAVLKKCLLENVGVGAEELARMSNDEIVDRHDRYHETEHAD